MAPKVQPNGRFAEALHKQMEKRKISIRQLAEATGAVYEHIRKLVAGQALPSQILLTAICATLDWDRKIAEPLVNEDQVAKKYPSIAAKATGLPENVMPVARQLVGLSDDQLKYISKNISALKAMGK